MRNSILVQGCKSLSLIEDCSKTNRTTYDEIFTVDLLGLIAFRAKILKKICKTDFELFLISHCLNLQKSVLQIYILFCMNVKSDPISYS